MTPHIYASPHAAVDELPMVHKGLSAGAVVATMIGIDFDGEERRSSDDRRSGTDRRCDKDRIADNRIYCLPRRLRGDRRKR